MSRDVMVREFHEKGFDEGTLVKLDLYRHYMSDWIPTFAAQGRNRYWKEINIYDFFCGKGEDGIGTPGSPIISIEETLKFRNLILKSGHKVNFYFFDESEEKIEYLKTLLDKYRKYPFLKFHCEAISFPESFEKVLSSFYNNASLLFIDQFGVKYVTPEIVSRIEKIKGTDLIFYVASSFWKRFAKTDEFRKYATVDLKDVADAKQSDMHRLICKSYQNSLPDSSGFLMTPFSIKKGANIYGLIHGSGHRLGSKKFLDVCWKLDPERGEADFDIDQDNIDNMMPCLFDEMNKPRKIQVFENEVEKAALTGDFKSDRDVFDFSLERGFIATKHASKVIKRLVKEGVLDAVEGQPRFSEVCIKNPRKLILKG